MAKATSQSQGAFSFLEEVEKTDPLPKPKKHTLKPPKQIEVEETKVDKEPEPLPEAEFNQLVTEDVDVINEDENPPKEEVLSENIEENQIEKDNIEPTDIIIEEETSASTLNESNNKPQEKKSLRGRKSVKEHTIAASMIEMPDDETLNAKQYYSMGEVTAMFNENHSLIRYWEKEFDILKPKKNGKGDRFFRPADVKNIYLIYDLLRRRKFTIEGAKDYIKNNKKSEEKFAAIQSLEKIKTFFLELKATL